ncbi:MAG: response regulator [Desulfobulbaceae bacterium]|nr:response regulator [Desulfobulbaceae bacterium]MCK5339873.1 response regulator [Desulfobulbaceae bacterium]MCK5405188.1 response regulator [Desulfobulbaceae bacterium]
MAEKFEAKVLLVDDEEQFLEMLSERLETRGLKVNSATSGEEALDLVSDKSFDAIVVDLAMPGIDGIETLRRIKEKRPDLEIIMLTGQATVKSGIEAMKLGAEDFLEKPVDINELLGKISEAKHKRMIVLEKKHKDELKKIMKSKSW